MQHARADMATAVRPARATPPPPCCFPCPGPCYVCLVVLRYSFPCMSDPFTRSGGDGAGARDGGRHGHCRTKLRRARRRARLWRGCCAAPARCCARVQWTRLVPSSRTNWTHLVQRARTAPRRGSTSTACPSGEPPAERARSARRGSKRGGSPPPLPPLPPVLTGHASSLPPY